jgi:hypothetical protein
MLVLSAAAAQPRSARVHAWDRPTGARLVRYRPLAEQGERPYVFRDIQVTAGGVAREVKRLDSLPGVTSRLITPPGVQFPVYRVDIAPRPVRGSRGKRPTRVALGAWMHGDEPVGAATVPRFVRWAVKQKNYRGQFDTTIFVKIDPTGSREISPDLNTNRGFMDGRWLPETRAIRNSLGKKTFDLFVDLHGSGGGVDGFWLIRGTDDGAMSRRILGAMPTRWLWDLPPQEATIASETCRCNFSMHCLGGVTSDSEGTFKWYMSQRGIPYSYTLEAPRHLTPEQQIRGTIRLLRSALYNVRKHGKL